MSSQASFISVTQSTNANGDIYVNKNPTHHYPLLHLMKLTNFEGRYKLRKAYQQEEQIKEELKLMKKYHGYKCQHIVLRVVYLVIDVTLGGVQLFVVEMNNTFL